MRKTGRWLGLPAVLGLVTILSGCRGTHDREGVNTAAAESQPAAAPAGSGDLIGDEPNSMAREDHERANQAGEVQQPVKRPQRPEPPLRPVTR